MVFSSLGVLVVVVALLLLVTATLLLRVTATLLAPVAASFHRYGILAVSPAVSRFGTTAGVLEEGATAPSGFRGNLTAQTFSNPHKSLSNARNSVLAHPLA
ncbi:hypothetical protein [Laribacter hongkongensis]|uniref:hypothetical protein n=1 Tax=Laribacter hongkongensis TaxID=168471 RepID=UPI0012DF7384|nr:hypothetical protein [Laribacter hongkongensis]